MRTKKRPMPTSHRALLIFFLRCRRASAILRCSELLEVEQRNLKRLLKPVDSPTIIFLVPNNRFDLMAQHSSVTASYLIRRSLREFIEHHKQIVNTRTERTSGSWRRAHYNKPSPACAQWRMH